jgi:hypothetical protein
MWKRNKIFISGIVLMVVLAGTLGGVAVAQANDSNTNPPQSSNNTLLEKVATIYQANTGTAIDPQELEKAFQQAGQEIKSEALDNYLKKLVEDGKITQEQADQFKAWLDARPAFPTDEFKKWMESRPDIPGLFGQDNHPGTRFFGMMHNGKGGFGFRFGGGLPK